MEQTINVEKAEKEIINLKNDKEQINNKISDLETSIKNYNEKSRLEEALQKLESNNPIERACGVYHLPKYHPESKHALLRALQDENEYVVGCAENELMNNNYISSKDVPKLTEILKEHKDSKSKIYVIRMLSIISTKDSLKSIKEFGSKNEDKEVRKYSKTIIRRHKWAKITNFLDNLRG